MKQTVLVINFEDRVSDEIQEHIISRLYIDYEDEIIGMKAFHLKNDLDMLQEVKKAVNK
jgi:hypothetical protein